MGVGIGGPVPTGDLMSRVYAGPRRYPAPGTSRDAYQKSHQLPRCRTFAVQVQAAAAASAATAPGRRADPRAAPLRGRGLCGHRHDRYGLPGPRSRYGNRATVPFGHPAGRAGGRRAEGPERSFPGHPAAAAGRSASKPSTSTGSAAGAHNLFTDNRFETGSRGGRIPRPGGRETSRRTSPPEMRLPGHDVRCALHPTSGSSRRDRPRRPSRHSRGQDHDVEERPSPRPDGRRRPGSTPACHLPNRYRVDPRPACRSRSGTAPPRDSCTAFRAKHPRLRGAGVPRPFRMSSQARTTLRGRGAPLIGGWPTRLCLPRSTPSAAGARDAARSGSCGLPSDRRGAARPRRHSRQRAAARSGRMPAPGRGRRCPRFRA